MTLLPLDVALVLGVGQVDGPVGALSRVILAPGDLSEALIEGEVVTDGVLKHTRSVILMHKIESIMQ